MHNIETYLKQVIYEACNNAKNCKMTMMPSLKRKKIVNEEPQCGGTQLKL